MKRRVAITGIGALTSLGNNWKEIEQSFSNNETGIQIFPECDEYTGIKTRLAAPLKSFPGEDFFTRKELRTMGKVAQMGVYATMEALIDANLKNDAILQSGRTGVAYGSSFGSRDHISKLAKTILTKNISGINSTLYILTMGHTVPVNISLYFGITGRIIPTSSACTSSTQAIGSAYETIAYGIQDVMISGGSDELSILDIIIFDALYATSTANDKPSLTPRPYDINRDGLVVGEAACSFVLEDWNRAKERGAKIHAEIVGYSTNSDGKHVTQPTAKTMKISMEEALNTAQLHPQDIGFISGHGTATLMGDIEESVATASLFGYKPFHSLKGHFGHTLGACGSLESWLGIEMMNGEKFYPTANLKDIDPECGDLDYIINEPRKISTEYIMNNNFAFGGINASLIYKRVCT